jgi:kynureninase
VPDGYALRPQNTGWYAEFGALGKKKEGVTRYGADGMRFWGATFDPSGLYRMNAVLAHLNSENVTVVDIHDHVMKMQQHFLDHLAKFNSPRLNADMLLVSNALRRGHFLTFRTEEAGVLQQLLEEHHIITDYRDDRLRFGFGIYHDKSMIEQLFERLKDIIK